MSSDQRKSKPNNMFVLYTQMIKTRTSRVSDLTEYVRYILAIVCDNNLGRTRGGAKISGV